MPNMELEKVINCGWVTLLLFTYKISMFAHSLTLHSFGLLLHDMLLLSEIDGEANSSR